MLYLVLLLTLGSIMLFLFLLSLALYPFLQDVSECVLYYYRNKKKENFKATWKKPTKKTGRLQRQVCRKVESSCKCQVTNSIAGRAASNWYGYYKSCGSKQNSSTVIIFREKSFITVKNDSNKVSLSNMIKRKDF